MRHVYRCSTSSTQIRGKHVYSYANTVYVNVFAVSCAQEDVLDDSVELEYGLNQQTVLRHRSASYHEPRPQKTHTPVEYSISAPITDPPHYPMEMKGESFGRRSPPPSYDAVVAQDTVYQTIYPNLEEELSHQQRMPKSSSTPLPDGHQ